VKDDEGACLLGRKPVENHCSCFREPNAVEICVLLVFCAEQNDSLLPTFRHNLLVWKAGTTGCTGKSVTTYHSKLRKIPEERRFHLHRGGSVRSRRA
jgi:hypothetical protein